MSEILQGLDGVECNIDDVLVHGKDQTEHDQRLEAVLMRLVEAGVTLNSSLVELMQILKSYKQLQTYKKWRTFLGMVNQLSKFSDHLADKTKSIRDLLHKGNQWTWGGEQQKAFEQIKSDLTRAPVLALYDPNKET